MVVKIVYYTCYKNEEYPHDIVIHDDVDYAYFKAIFDALLERGYTFALERVKENVDR